VSTIQRAEHYLSKVIYTDNVIQYYNYSKPIYKGVKSDRDNYEKSLFGEKSKSSLHRARNNLLMTINANVTTYSKFITLTTKNTVLDRDVFLQYFKQFQKNFYRIFGYNIKYVSVLERQKERGRKEGNKGSWHIHMIVFNPDKIDFEKLKQAWQYYGSVDIKKVRQVEELGIYMVKYLTKDNVQFHKKTVLKSKQLIEPIIEYSVFYNSPTNYHYQDKYIFFRSSEDYFTSENEIEEKKVEVEFYEKYTNPNRKRKKDLPVILTLDDFDI
jgi:hypothetical protein